MCDGRCGRRYVHYSGKGTTMVAPDLPVFFFTPAQRREQDGRLRSIIAAAWEKDGGVAWWRGLPEVQEQHRQWAASYRIDGTQAWAEYVEIVLAMTWAATGYFVPIDFWPFIPPPVPLNQTGHRGFRDVLNGQRLVAGVFSLDNLRANKHYALLLAHLIWCPDPIDDAAHLIAPPYPWPFLLKQDEVKTFRVERQEDIGDTQWKIAEQIERKLFRDAKQARAYGVSAASRERQKEKQDRMAPVERAAGRAITRAYDDLLASGAAGKDIISAIMVDPTVQAACNVTGAEIPLTPRKIRDLHREDCKAHGLDLPKPGRPAKRSSGR